MTTKELREAQVLAVTAEERENLDENNPIIHAESAPNRFSVLTFFFPEEDGVTIEEDLDLNVITIKYFDTEGNSIELEEGGALYDWALDLYEND